MTSKMYKIRGKTDLQRKLKLILVFSVTVLLFTISIADAAFFDTSGKSARAMGMGEVFLLSSSDAAGYWYNPAGLSRFKDMQLGIGYGRPAASISDLMNTQLNFVTPIGEKSGLGFGLAFSGIDVASDLVISGAYGTTLGENLSVGGNLKIMRWAVEGQEITYGTGTDDDISKLSFSLDLSAAYSFGEIIGLDDFVTGVYVKDAIMPNISESGDEGGKLPIELGIGFMAQRNLLSVGGDVAFVDGVTVFKIGAESGITGSDLKIRGGFIYGSDFEEELEKADFDVGLGYIFGPLAFDYAYNYPTAFEKTGGKHYVSFGISF